MSCVQLSEGSFQVVYPLGLWSRSSGVVKVLHKRIWLVNYIYIYIYPMVPVVGGVSVLLDTAM